MFVVIHFFARLCNLIKLEPNPCKFYRMFIPVLPLDIQLSRWEGWDPVTRFTPHHLCVCPKPRHGFPTIYVAVFFRVQYLEVAVRFVVNDGIVDQHSLKILHS